MRAAAHRRIPLVWWLTSIIVKRFVGPRLKVPTTPLTRRPLQQPTPVLVPTRHGTVTCWTYRPDPQPGPPPPVHLQIHGGGFVMTNPRQDDHISHYLASEVGTVVVSIDYSTAPHVRFPVAEQECDDVLQWISTSGAEQGWDGGRISVGGFSAGGKLALSTLQEAHRTGTRVRAAYCGYPVLDVSMDAGDLTSPIANPMISKQAFAMIQDTYFVDRACRTDPLASPWLDPLLAEAMPPTLFLAAEHDTLTPKIASLVTRLTQEGAPVTYVEFAGQDHAWTHTSKAEPGALREAVTLLGDHLRAHV